MSVQNVPVQAKSDATGKATFAFPPVTRGQWWHVACLVPTAPTAAAFQLFVDGTPRFKWLGPLPSAAVVVQGGSQIKVVGTGLAASTTYAAMLTGSWSLGTAQGVPPQGPSSFSAVANITTNITTVHVLPVVKTVGVFTGRRLLAGTTTRTLVIPTTVANPTYWKDCKIGFSIWGTGANTGTWIYVGVAAGTTTPTTWARIPSGKGNGKTQPYGVFSVPWGDPWTARIAGKTGDHANVWAA